jgi:UDPglucose 6-dehydrogenase
MRRFSVVGLGKLGACMAAAIASRGFPVIGVDVEERAVERLNDGRAPVREPGLDRLVADNRERLRATTSHDDAVGSSDVTFVVVPTPSDETGGFSNDCVAIAFRAIGRALAAKRGYHTVVLTSTVLPGSTRLGLLPILEEESGKTCGKDFGLCYSPEFIALGSVIRDLLNPDFLLVGESDRRAGDALESCYAEIVLNEAPCKRMSFENAELAKIALNAYVTTKITFANILADLCERFPGGDVDVVTDCIGLDRRVGRAYLTGGLGFGGPCFPRDNAAFAHVAKKLGARAELAETTQRANENVVERVVDRIRPFIEPGTNVAVLGLSFKPGSHVTEEAQGLVIATRLAELGASVVGYDPLVEHVGSPANHSVRIVDSLRACLRAEILVVANPDAEFRSLRVEDLVHGPRVVVDCWRILDGGFANDSRVTYIALGLGYETAMTSLMRDGSGATTDDRRRALASDATGRDLADRLW